MITFGNLTLDEKGVPNTEGKYWFTVENRNSNRLILNNKKHDTFKNAVKDVYRKSQKKDSGSYGIECYIQEGNTRERTTILRIFKEYQKEVYSFGIGDRFEGRMVGTIDYGADVLEGETEYLPLLEYLSSLIPKTKTGKYEEVGILQFHMRTYLEKEERENIRQTVLSCMEQIKKYVNIKNLPPIKNFYAQDKRYSREKNNSLSKKYGGWYKEELQMITVLIYGNTISRNTLYHEYGHHIDNYLWTYHSETYRPIRGKNYPYFARK